MPRRDQRAGDEHIGKALEKYEASLIRFAARILGDWERARDVTQETFARLLSTDEVTSDHQRRWLFLVCRNLALDVRRKERRALPGGERPPGPNDAVDWQSPSPLVAVEQKEEHRLLLECLEMLPSNQQEVTRLRLQAGLSYVEISEVTGLTVSNVGFLLHTALKEIQKQIKEQLSAPTRRRGGK